MADADIVCCATTARTPLFDAGLVRPHTTVVAVGSHEPDARELPAELMTSPSRPLAGTTDLIPLAAVVRHEVTVPDDRPRVVKSVGMAWDDLAVAAAVYEGQAS